MSERKPIRYYRDGTKLIGRRTDETAIVHEIGDRTPLEVEAIISFLGRGFPVAEILSGARLPDRSLPGLKISAVQQKKLDAVIKVFSEQKLGKAREDKALPSLPNERRTAIDNIKALAATEVRNHFLTKSAWWEMAIKSPAVLRELVEGAEVSLLDEPLPIAAE